MAEHHLPAGARRILKALIEVVKPRKPGFDPPLEDFMLKFLDDFYSYFPFHMKLLFPLGLYLLEYGTFIFDRKLLPFSRLSLEAREKSVRGWVNSRMLLRRDLIKGVKGVCLTAFYSHPQVMKHIGYDLEAHLERVNRGEPCDPVATEFFRSLGYDRATKVGFPGLDNAEIKLKDFEEEPEVRQTS